jgi:hypothetical protein
MKNLFLLAITIWSISSCTNNLSHTSAKNQARDSTIEEMELAEKKAKEESHWMYNKKKDDMTSETKYSAVLISDVILPTDSTEEGGSGVLMLMLDGKKTDVLLHTLEKDFASTADGFVIKVKFDNDKPTDFNCLEAHSPDYLIIEKSDAFLKRLKSAKKVLIQAEEINLMHFNSTGLKWIIN